MRKQYINSLTRRYHVGHACPIIYNCLHYINFVSEKISKKHKAFNLLQNNNGELSKKIVMIDNLSHGVVQKSNSPSITTGKENQISTHVAQQRV